MPGDGRVVSVGGPLRYGDFATTLAKCTAFEPVAKKELRACCNRTWGQILVGEGTARGKAIYLEGVGCSGDESRSCCDLIVNGQQVVVTGALHEKHDRFGEPSRYSLGPSVKICGLDGATRH